MRLGEAQSQSERVGGHKVPAPSGNRILVAQPVLSRFI